MEHIISKCYALKFIYMKAFHIFHSIISMKNTQNVFIVENSIA